MKKISILFLLVAFVFSSWNIEACTTAIISGKYTVDGRPLLWKHRDTWSVNNSIHYFTEGKYTYMGLINSKDYKHKSVWIGMNSEGFAIMNSASYNLNAGDTAKLTGLEGRIMKKALANCANLADFEKLLSELALPTGLEANFGVIDADGGAAYYELGHRKFEKIDVNDPAIAPFGYIIRANYSYTGKIGLGSGYIRYRTADKLFYEGFSTNKFNAQYILQNISHSLKHSLTGDDLLFDYRHLPANTPAYHHFRDFIPRTGSSSSVVVEGVKKGESPDYTTLWAVVGFPLTSVVIPTWIKGGKDIPELLRYKKELDDSPICHAALQLKKNCLPIRWGKNEAYYINVNTLVNADKTGMMQLLAPYENEIFKQTYEKLNTWRNGKISQSEIKQYYNWLDQYVRKTYAKSFDMKL